MVEFWKLLPVPSGLAEQEQALPEYFPVWCSASWGLRVVCAFLKKKYIHLSVAPKPLAFWNKAGMLRHIFNHFAFCFGC